MSDMRDIYQELVLEHKKHPRNFGRLPNHTHTAQGHNPLCGDKIDLDLTVEDGVIKDVRFEGEGCAISTASASIMTEVLKGKPVAEAEKLFGVFTGMLKGANRDGLADGLPGKLRVFEGVTRFPARVKCAGLAWHTLHSALSQANKPASTE